MHCGRNKSVKNLPLNLRRGINSKVCSGKVKPSLCMEKNPKSKSQLLCYIRRRGSWGRVVQQMDFSMYFEGDTRKNPFPQSPSLPLPLILHVLHALNLNKDLLIKTHVFGLQEKKGKHKIQTRQIMEHFRWFYWFCSKRNCFWFCSLNQTTLCASG